MERTDLSNTGELYQPIDTAPEPYEPETGFASVVRETPDGLQSLVVLVGGITCALCLQKIESALNAEPDVHTARLNYGARRLVIEWDGYAARANDFVRIVEGLGYSAALYDEKSAAEAVKAEERFLLLCLGVAGFAMGNVMLLSVGVWSTSAETMGVATRDFLHWMAAVIALPAVLFSGRPFFRSALKALRNGHTNMDVPISLALVLASGASLHEAMNHGEHVYFDSAIMLTFFLLIGRYLDFKARENARGAAHDLLSSFQGFASVVEGREVRRIPIREIEEGMVVSVAAGESFPVDGVVVEGRSSVDTALITGETLPRDVDAGEAVFAGTMNLSAPVTMRVEKAAEDSLLSDIVRLMDKAGQAQAAYTRIADRAAKLYTPVVHVLAAASFVGWLTIGGAVWQDALMIAVTVLIITCPCALGLAVPVVQILATTKLMKAGVFVKSGDALERLAAVGVAIFDKTGTLTLGQPALVNTIDIKDLQLAASLAQHSAHPLSRAIVAAYDGAYLDIRDIREHAGEGLSGKYKDRVIKLGSRDFCGYADGSPALRPEIWLRKKKNDTIRFEFEDALRDDAPVVIAGFKDQFIPSYMLSGDREESVGRIAEAVKIEHAYAQQNPAQKFAFLEKLKASGQNVLMVGDGLNDAPVLAAADVSIAPGTAIDMAQNAADIIFMGDRLSPVALAHKTALRTQTLIRQNFALAIIYNLLAIPLAVAGFVTPFVAALAMSGSSIIVIANSFRLKFKA